MILIILIIFKKDINNYYNYFSLSERFNNLKINDRFKEVIYLLLRHYNRRRKTDYNYFDLCNIII